MGLEGERLRQPKVQDLHCSCRCDLYIGRFEIAVDDSFLVRRFKGFGNLPRDTECFLDWDRSTLSQPLGQGWTLDKFENQRVSIVRLFETIDCANIRMIEGSQHAGFPLESAHPARIVRLNGWQYLN